MMHKFVKTLLITGPLFTGVLLLSSFDAAYAANVNCDTPNASIQKAVDNADGPTTIFINGSCVGDVTITKDDITLSGNKDGLACIAATPGGTGTIDGTVTVDGVRATIEFLTITGGGDGVRIENRADVHLTCNDISANKETGVLVLRSSNAILRDNTLNGNGTRTANPFIFFDCGLYVLDASSVLSNGNTYTDNQWCAIDVDRQSAFRNGDFLPRKPGHPADPDDRDVITELGCTPSTGSGCDTNDFGPVAIQAFNGGLVDLRNADVNGEIRVEALSSFRVDADAAILGNIINSFGSMVRLRNRSFLGDREVTYTGTLTCNDTSQAFYSNVQCGQTCTGPIPGSCGP
jgi:parallel beta-helix repeat protein